ncbi:MAG TPA: hypothetical protein VJI13_02865 [Candidatus Norongarragalinales archaeon]|nr:hypothetical protein [Candidatus Norongarragalinales archaeon]
MRMGMVCAWALLLIAYAALADAATYNVTRIAGSYESGFTINDLQQAPDRVYPGDEVRLQFDLENLATVTAENVEVNVLVPFISQTSNYFLDDMASGAKKRIVVNFNIPNSTKPGAYTIYVYAAGSQGVDAQVAEILLTINEPLLSNALIATVESGVRVFAGDAVNLPVTLENVGSRNADDVIIQMQYTSGNVLLPIGSDRMHIESIQADSSSKVDFKTGISPSAEPGYYPITLLVTYKVDKVLQPTITQTFGIKVESKTDLLLTADTSTASTSTTSQNVVVTVANVGDTPVRGVYVSAESSDFRITGTSEKFFGTLNLDDSVTMSLTLVPRGGAQGSGKINVEVSYKDSLNVEHTQKKEIEVGASTSASGTGNSLQNGAIGSTQRFGRTSQQFTILGQQPVVIGGAVAVLLVALFGYKWYKRRHK